MGQPKKTRCIKKCRLDKNDICLGCHRTIEEIKYEGLRKKSYKRKTSNVPPAT